MTNDDSCYDRLQTVYPIFATDPLEQRRMLMQSSDSTRGAFNNALDCYTSTVGPLRPPASPTDLKTTSQLCIEAEFEAASLMNSIILVQTYILLALTAQELGPSLAHAGSATSSQKFLSQAYTLILGLESDRALKGSGDSDVKMVRRLHVVTYILDRWLAVGFASPFRVQVPSDRLVLLPKDKDVLGPQCYQMARMATLLTQLAKASHAFSPSSPPSPRELEQRSVTADLMQTLLDRTADDFAAFGDADPLLQAAFRHVDLLAQRLKPETDVEAVTRKTLRLLDTLDASFTSPLGYDFAALCSLSVADIALHEPGNKAVASSVSRLEQILNTRYDPLVSPLLTGATFESAFRINVT